MATLYSSSLFLARARSGRSADTNPFFMDRSYIENSMTVNISLLKRCTSHNIPICTTGIGTLFSFVILDESQTHSYLLRQITYFYLFKLNKRFWNHRNFVLNAVIVLMCQDWETIQKLLSKLIKDKGMIITIIFYFNCIFIYICVISFNLIIVYIVNQQLDKPIDIMDEINSRGENKKSIPLLQVSSRNSL